MLSLGCIQALKCNTNRCPTGITTSDEERAKSLDVPVKSIRVQNYQSQTVLSCCELTGA